MLITHISNVLKTITMDVELQNWLRSGKYRVEVLKLLYEKPYLPSELAKELSVHRSSMARILSDLLKERLVSRTVKNTKTKTYFLTQEGRAVSAELLKVIRMASQKGTRSADPRFKC